MEAPLENWLELVKKVAKEKKMSQRKIASKAGLSASYISEIFTGKKEPKFSTAISIFLALGVVPKIEFKDINNGDKEKRHGSSC